MNTNRLQLGIYGIMLTAAFAASAIATEPVPLSSLDLDYSKLKSWGTRKYKVVKTIPQPDGKLKLLQSGTSMMITKITDDKVLFLDRKPGPGETYDYTLSCAKAPLLPTKQMSLKIWVGNKLAMKGLFNMVNGKASGKIGEQPAGFDLPADTVTHAALLRIISLLPRDKDARYSFKRYCQMYELVVSTATKNKPFEIICLGNLPTTIGKKKMNWTKYHVQLGAKYLDVYVDSSGVVQRTKDNQGMIIDLVR